MNGKELYEKYKGRKAIYVDLNGKHEGTVVGYSIKEEWMVIALTKGHGWGEFVCGMDDSIIILQKKHNRKGFLFIDEKNIIK